MTITDTSMVQTLNDLIAAELLASATYTVQAALCANWGFHKLAAKLAEEAGEEQGHLKRLADRVVLLGGIPAPSAPPVEAGTDVPGQLSIDLDLETEAVTNYRRAVAEALESNDPVSRVLLESILADEEHHQQWLRTQLHQIHEMGLSNYLTLWV